MGNFLVAHGHAHRISRDFIGAVHHVVFRCVRAQVGQGCSHVNFDAFGHALAHADVVLAAHILLDVGRKVVAGHFDGVVRNDASQRDDGDLGRAAAYVDDHVAFGRVHVDADADGGCHRFEEQVNVASAGMFCRVAHGTQLHFGRARRHADDHAQRGREEAFARMHHFNEPAHHLFAGVEVGNHAVAQRPYHADVVVRLLIHELGPLAHGFHFVGVAVERHDRRFVHGNLPVAHDDGVGSAKVDGQFLRKGKKVGEKAHSAPMQLVGMRSMDFLLRAAVGKVPVDGRVVVAAYSEGPRGQHTAFLELRCGPVLFQQVEQDAVFCL